MSDDTRDDTTSKRYCKDCRYCRMPQRVYDFPTNVCTREESRDPVGCFQPAASMRKAAMPCGPNAKLFEQKPASPLRLMFWKRWKLK